MNTSTLVETANAMVADGEGILAIDESSGTIQKRFDNINVECTEDSRRIYRQMLLTTPGLGEHISGAILFDETLRQSTSDGTPFTTVMQEVTPNNMRGVVNGMYVVTTNVLGLALGPTLVAASTDYIFQDTMAVAKSLALVAVFVGPIAVYLLNQGRRSYIELEET